jgi:hypothetical protein
MFLGREEVHRTVKFIVEPPRTPRAPRNGSIVAIGFKKGSLQLKMDTLSNLLSSLGVLSVLGGSSLIPV